MSPRRRTDVHPLVRAGSLAAAALLALAGCGQEGGTAGSAPTPSATAAPTTGSTMTTPPSDPSPPSPEPGSATPSAPAPTQAPTPSPSRSVGGTLPLLPRPTAPPTAPTDVPQPVVLVGEVVEPSAEGCVEMTSGGQVFALRLPEGAGVRVGERVRVTGTPRPVEGARTCAGTTVVVTEVAPA